MTTTSTVLPSVCLPSHLAEEIIDHSREGAPEEICGVLRGRGLRAYEVVRGQNVAEERIENYTVDPQTLLRQFDFEDAGDEMMGIYHSHPVSEAYPSATDAWNSHYPDAVYFICSLEDKNAPVIRAFRMTTHFLGPESEQMIRTLPFYETRPGLFAHFEPAGSSLQPPLDSLVGNATAPLYIVYSTAGDAGHDLDIHAVSIVEHPIIEDCDDSGHSTY